MVELYNSNGQRCNYAQKSTSSGAIKIDIQNLPSGVYILSITQNLEKTYQKVIKD
jgi:hypothetical protein